MKPSAAGYRVAVVGASSLLGKELLAVLKERKFPISRLVTFEDDEEEPGLSIVDLREHSQTAVADNAVTDAELDFAFLAARPRELPLFLRPASDNAGLRQPDSPSSGATPRPAPLLSGQAKHCVVIDLDDGLAEMPGGVLKVPFLEREPPHCADASVASKAGAHPGEGNARLFVSAHPAAIILSSLLLRLAARFELKSAVALVFGPASEIGSQAIEELQKQTVNLLSFQKIPRSIFGAQLAFNLLPRLGRTEGSGLADLENRIRNQLRTYLASRAPLPALRLFQAPVFYSLAFSLFVEMAKPETPEAIAQALKGKPFSLRSLSEQAPTPVEAAGASNILVDAIRIDPGRPSGVWLLAAADNLRLAAVNAVEIAESLQPSR